MKKTIFSLAAIAMLSAPVFATGFLYNDTVEPTALSQQQVTSSKAGRAECNNYFGMVQLGDCSYEAAMKNGRIAHVNHHDTRTVGWFFFKHIVTKVYGD